MTTPSGKEQLYGRGAIPSAYLYTVFAITGATLIPTLGVVVLYLFGGCRESMLTALQVAWVWWVVAPPIWFSFEYFILFKQHGPNDAFESFKYGQDVSAKAWIAFVLVLTGILEKKL
jgi:hypothetical protein